MREPAQWDFLIHQNTCGEKCVLLLKSTWQSARGFFLSVHTKGACKQKLPQKNSVKNALNPSTFFSFQSNIIQRCFIHALPSWWCLCLNLCRNLCQEFFFYQTQNVLPIFSYEGGVHWAFSLALSPSLACAVPLPSSCYFPVNVLWTSQQRHPNQPSFGALEVFPQLRLLANTSIICSQPGFLNCSGLQIMVGSTDNSPAIWNKLELNYQTLGNGGQIPGHWTFNLAAFIRRMIMFPLETTSVFMVAHLI